MCGFNNGRIGKTKGNQHIYSSISGNLIFLNLISVKLISIIIKLLHCDLECNSIIEDEKPLNVGSEKVKLLMVNLENVCAGGCNSVAWELS